MQVMARRPGIINMSYGTPDFPTPPHIIVKGQQVLADRQNSCTAWVGFPKLCMAIAAKLEQ